MEYKIVWNALDASRETAWESPLEKGVFHYPAGSVDVEPPEFNPEKQICTWTGSEWSVSDIPSPPVLGPPPLPDPPPAEESEGNPEPPELPEMPEMPEYKIKRLLEYGDIDLQIEFITENGLEAWQEKVAAIKEKYPKT